MSKYANDPRWIKARFQSVCQCGRTITKGADVFYYPIGKKALCAECGTPRALEFQAAAQDEAFMNGGAW